MENYYRDLCNDLESKLFRASEEIEVLKQKQQKLEDTLWHLSYNWNTLTKSVIGVGVILTILVVSSLIA